MLLFEDLDLPLQTVWALIERIIILYFIWDVTHLLKHLFKGLLKPKDKKGMCNYWVPIRKKTCFRVSDKEYFKPVSSATETS